MKFYTVSPIIRDHIEVEKLAPLALYLTTKRKIFEESVSRIADGLI